MVALGTAVILTFLAGMGFVLYRLVSLEIEAARSEMMAAQRALKADVDKVSLDNANLKVIAEAAVYTAQRAEEKARGKEP